ncbi:MAG: hypothetical protein RLZ84_1611 [Actinomycetota bacterium]
MTTPTDTNDDVKYQEISSSIHKMLADRAAGGIVTGTLEEDEMLFFNYADMFVSAHLRYHYDGHMVREGGTLLLVLNTLVTRAPRDMRSLLCILDNGSRYPYTSVSVSKERRDAKSAGWINVYGSLVAESVTESQIDLALRSMVQHFHQIPLELGAWGIDVGRRRRSIERRRTERIADSEAAASADDEIDENSCNAECQDSSRQAGAESKIGAIDEDRLADSLRGLNELIGLESVKKEIEGLVAVTKYNLTRSESGLTTPPFAPHLVFVGNPGTAKTTVASHVAKIYQALGLLEKEQVKVVSRVDLVAGYTGQTAIKTKDVFEEAMGGVLFIDEAYSLTDEKEGFGLEAVQTMLLEMENNRGHIAVFLAGYPDRMKHFIESNPGLQSRFDRTITFPDYSNRELEEIFLHLAKRQDFFLEDAAHSALIKRIETFSRNRDFGNGREARRWLEAAIEEQAKIWLASGAHTNNDTLRSLSVEAIKAGLDRFSLGNMPKKNRVGYI